MRARPEAEHFDVQLKYGTVGAVAVRPGGPCRRRDLDRRPHRQALGPDRRFADHRRRHLCRRPRLRGLGDRRRRIFHPRRRRPRDLRADPHRRRRARSAAADAVIAEVAALGGTRRSDRRHARRARALCSFNTPGMYRGMASPAGRSVAIYGDERAPARMIRGACCSRFARFAAARCRARRPWPGGNMATRRWPDRLARASARTPAPSSTGCCAQSRLLETPTCSARTIEAGELLARLHQDARRALQLRLALALSECRHLPAVRSQPRPAATAIASPPRSSATSACSPTAACRRASG